MDKLLNDYLAQVENCLRPLTASERVDIVAEIKSQMLESQAKEGLSSQEILARLGDARALARAYLGDSIARSRFSLRRLLACIAFGGMAGLGGMFVLPIFGVLTVGFLFAGVIAPLAGLLKTGGWFLGFDMPFIMFQFGSYSLHPLLVLPLSLAVGALFFALAMGCWWAVKAYMRAAGKAHRALGTAA
ncbi:MAG: hypothetical protein HFJ86_11040 [Oscillospiraceae bacterium]|jgi:uncharacterized membrane protein|nr:hypothetical protein [Oscillospiraceae bacterium]